MRRVGCILLIRDDGKFLLQHRGNDVKRAPGMWGFFGGGLEVDETPEQGILREAKEELDIDVVDYHFALEQDFVSVDDPIAKKWIFVAPFEKQGPITQHEGQGMGWFSIDELDSLNIIPHDEDAIIAILKK